MTPVPELPPDVLRLIHAHYAHEWLASVHDGFEGAAPWKQRWCSNPAYDQAFCNGRYTVLVSNTEVRVEGDIWLENKRVLAIFGFREARAYSWLKVESALVGRVICSLARSELVSKQPGVAATLRRLLRDALIATAVEWFGA